MEMLPRLPCTPQHVQEACHEQRDWQLDGLLFYVNEVFRLPRSFAATLRAPVAQRTTLSIPRATTTRVSRPLPSGSRRAMSRAFSASVSPSRRRANSPWRQAWRYEK